MAEQSVEKTPTPLHALKDTFAEVLAPIRAVGGPVWDTLAPAVNHGKSEVAAALFTGNAYVMYQKSLETPEPMTSPDLATDIEKKPELAQEQSRGLGL